MKTMNWGIAFFQEFLEVRIIGFFSFVCLFFLFLHLKLRFRMEVKVRGLKASVCIRMILFKKEYILYEAHIEHTGSSGRSKAFPLHFMLKHIIIHKGDVFGVIGVGNPAHTAILYGVLMGVWPTLNMCIGTLTKGRFFKLKLYPCMKSRVFHMNVVCIFCFKIWHIIAIFVHLLPKKGEIA